MTVEGRRWQHTWIEKPFGNFYGLFSLRLKNSKFVVECFALCLSEHTGDWGWTPWVGQEGTGVSLSKRICCTLVHSSIWELLSSPLWKYRIPSHHLFRRKATSATWLIFFGLFSCILFLSVAYVFLLLWGFCKFHITNVFNFPSIYKTAEKKYFRCYYVH